MKQKALNWKKELDEKALNIEFLLVSVIQGVALSTLAANAVAPLGNLQLEYWFYIFSGFLLVLIFWSQSILHALSFIDWPLDLVHSFLYFLASFVEVMAFSHILEPFKWFSFVTGFLIVGAVLYIYDLVLIKKHKKDYSTSSTGKQLYVHLYNRQVKELKLLVPSAIILNGASAFLIYRFPLIFLENKFHLVLSIIQFFSSIVLVIISLKSFNDRSRLITRHYAEKEKD